MLCGSVATRRPGRKKLVAPCHRATGLSAVLLQAPSTLSLQRSTVTLKGEFKRWQETSDAPATLIHPQCGPG